MIAIPMLKAAPERDQVADRLSGGDWRGLELCLAPRHVATPEALDAAIAVGRGAADRGVAVTAECPVAWPSGAFVRVDRLDEEARRGIEASARFAAGIGSPVLTVHLFAPMTPAEYRLHGALDSAAVDELPALLRRRVRGRGRHRADRERAPRAADAHRRRLPLLGRLPLARLAAVVRARRRPAGDPRHLTRGAVRALRRRQPVAVRPRLRRRPRARALR